MATTRFYFAILFCAASILQGVGCQLVYTVHTTPLDHPIPRELKVPSYFSQLPTGERTASIGDDLFVLRRFVSGAKDVVAVKAPSGFVPFPVGAAWVQTHMFTEEETGHQFAVYTCPGWYDGAYGVVLDDEDRLATVAPLVQVTGGKRGNRFELGRAGTKFFEIPVDLVEAWALRFGGRRGSDYVFEIVNKPNSTVVDVVQSIQVSEADFLGGFTVRGVYVKGMSEADKGIVRFTLEDQRVDR